MKTNLSKSLTLMTIFIILGGCTKTIIQDVAPQLEIFVSDISGGMISGAEVQLYENPEDWELDKNSIKTGTTGQSGTILFSDLAEQIYYFRATKGFLNNDGLVSSLADPLKTNVKAKVQTTIRSVGIGVIYSDDHPSEVITDPRDWNTYKYKTIGTQTWMIENLAYLPEVNHPDNGSDVDPCYYVYGYEGTSISVAKTADNYDKYGVLYNWAAAKTACPEGWDLPSDEEWTILTNYLENNGFGYGGSGSDIGKSMASISGWMSSSSAGEVGNDQGSNNSSGFNAFPGGNRSYGGGFHGLGSSALFWSSSPVGSSYAWRRDLGGNRGGVYRGSNTRRYGFSVRCLQN